MTKDQFYKRVVRPLVFILCLGPLAWLVWAVLGGAAGANPIEYMNRFLGDWALRMLLISLTMSPLAKILSWSWPARARRMIGLFALFYVLVHLTSYIAIDQFFDWTAIGKDILKRTYITVGMVTIVLLIPLGITSTNNWRKKLGFRRWRLLHRLVYPAAILGVFHHTMMVKADLFMPIVHGSILAVLLGWRVWERWLKARSFGL